MGASLKRLIQEKLHESQEKKYEEEQKLQKDSYAAFLRSFEAGKDAGQIKTTGQKVETDLPGVIKPVYCTPEYLVFVKGEGSLSSYGLTELEAYFKEHPDTQVVYFHTDETDAEGKRSNPLFLPEWSPDTLASCFYFERCFAVRRESYLEAAERLIKVMGGSECREDAGMFLYTVVLLLTAHHPAVLLDLILYHQKNADLSKMQWTDGLLIDKALKIFGQTETQPTDCTEQELWGCWLDYKKRKKILDEAHKISILIPSKDHPEVLERCVASVRRYSVTDMCKETDGVISYEIIVVDNGSTPENRKQYEACSEKYEFHYEYLPMEFNFSKMCNLAAGMAEGDYLLFLNDDMEVCNSGWLEQMLELACLPHAGAVGAKLYYPGTTLIQHAGITNMYEGPAHKLLRYEDAEEYYGGRNRGVWDMIGVTAACMMVDREKFEILGGFSEELQVAYNDVDFCFRLHRRGWYNIVRNDLTLYHHESLSRGNDHLDSKKMARLAAERKILYQRNPAYYDYDPFYSRHLTGASEAYECVLPYENRNIRPVREVKRVTGSFPGCALNETLIINVDFAGKEQFVRDGKAPSYLIDLHAHVRGLDSCDYHYRMVLKGERYCYEIPAVRRLRPDVSKTLEQEKHVELSGFAARIPEGMLPEGVYEIYMEAKCVFSRQKLCNRAAVGLRIGQESMGRNNEKP